MKTEQELIEHVTAATGMAEAEVRKAVDAAFAFVRESALSGAGLVYPALGAIKVRERIGKDGTPKTVYRFDPSGKVGGGRAGAGAGGAGRGRGRGAGRRAGAKPAGDAS
jgi:nucleoid DNA-binding protein